MTLADRDSPSHVAVTLRHRSLHTTFRGIRHPASTPQAVVHQFRGIKYASIPVRFRRAVLHQSYPQLTDATKHGAISPQIKNKWLESRLYGLPSDIVPKPTYVPPMDEHDCLNLTITAPAQESLPAELQDEDCLPVMVWIHGGGNVTGAASEWICDPGSLVQRSIELSMPVIIISLNYRLGLLGFGASELLRQDNASVGEEGVGNYGLHDQRTALMWIRKHIAGFGGDPNNVTLFGSSWGAADIHAHLLSTANYNDITTPPSPTSHGPLFHRAILQSGALVPSSSVVQDVYSAGRHLSRIMSALHIRTIDELRAVPAAKLVALTGERVRPVDDGVFLRQDWKTLSLPVATSGPSGAPPQWRQDVMIGDVACESVLWAIPARLWGADAVARRARAIVQSVRRADVLMRAYDIVENAQRGHSVEEALMESSGSEIDIEAELSEAEEAECELAERVMELINDVAFAWPVDVAARCAADSAYVFDDAMREQLMEEEGGEGDEVHAVDMLSPSVTVSDADSDRTGGTPPPSSPKRLQNAPYVYRYVFDQASPYTDTPHHGVDLLYLFGNIPFPLDPELTPEENDEVNWDRVKVRDEMQRRWLEFAAGKSPWEPLTPQAPTMSETLAEARISTSASSRSSSFSTPAGLSPFTAMTPIHPPHKGGNHIVHTHVFTPASSRSNSFSQHDARSAFLNSHSHRRDSHGTHSPHPHSHPHPFATSHSHAHASAAAAAATSASAHGPNSPGPAHMPISVSDSDKVFVFGPEGETGARSKRIFEGRRRVHAWREALAPLGLATAQKVGLELGNGPPVAGVARF